VESLGLKRAWRFEDRYGIALCVEVIAWITAGHHRHRRAATLFGAADVLWTDIGTPIASFLQLISHHNACEQQLRHAIGDAAFSTAFQHGQALTFEGAIAYALNEPRQPAATPHRDTPTPLTRREQQVADLVARGLSNKEIAATLVISQRTAEGHVETILTKLGFTKRAQVAAWITEKGGA
jgi:DNA-binding NarL/FixJ family response regulator